MTPVVLAARSDAPVAVAVKLFRAFPEDRYSVLGVVEVPGTPMATYVPDAHGDGITPTTCCRGLSSDAIAAGEASRGWGAVATADGTLHYVRIDEDGVRRFDSDAAPIELPLAAAPSIADDAAGFGAAAQLPVAVTGGVMTVLPTGPSAPSSTRSRRMLIATGSDDGSGEGALFVCDEGETLAARCTALR